jgi:hypothetical protein
LAQFATRTVVIVGAAAAIFGSYATAGRAVAVRTSTPPVLDGRLDEATWDQAFPLTELRQFQPKPGQPLSERTELLILYDAEYLYLGIRCHDRKPSGIVGRGMQRDGSVLQGDHVQFFFDTFRDKRNGYAFAVSPDGGRWDALVSNTFTVNSDWNGIWECRSRIDAIGWTSEVRIPFATLNFDESSEAWGFNFSRWIARHAEGGRWVAPRPEVATYYAGNAGTLAGLSGIGRGLGLQATPYLLTRHRFRRFGNDSTEFENGLDLQYRLTPSLNGTLSLNTDFAETEVDQLQLNFSRFPLFFPEKRAFFLQDSGIYEFAGLNQGTVIPYYSRRIGLDPQGQPVPIVAAGKISGRAGPYELGFTSALLDSTATTDSTPVFVGRATRPVNGNTTVGILATSGDPRSGADNHLGGFDLRYQRSDLFGDQTLVANAFALATETSPETGKDFSGHAVGLGISYPGDRINISAQASEISGGFDPALGFIERNDVRILESSWRYLLRPESQSGPQWFSFVYANKFYTDLDSNPVTSSHSVFPLAVRLRSDDEVSLGFTRTSDRTFFPFTIPGGSTIAPDEYDMTTFNARVTFADRRVLSGNLTGDWGDFYGGNWIRAGANLWWNPDPRLTLGLNYEWNEFVMPDTTIDSQIVSLWFVTRFNPEMRWSNLAQYDSLSNTLGWNSRYSWEFQPGKNLNIVFNQLLWKESDRFRVLESDATVKANFVFRF